MKVKNTLLGLTLTAALALSLTGCQTQATAIQEAPEPVIGEVKAEVREVAIKEPTIQERSFEIVGYSFIFKSYPNKLVFIFPDIYSYKEQERQAVELAKLLPGCTASSISNFGEFTFLLNKQLTEAELDSFVDYIAGLVNSIIYS